MSEVSGPESSGAAAIIIGVRESRRFQRSWVEREVAKPVGPLRKYVCEADVWPHPDVSCLCRSRWTTEDLCVLLSSGVHSFEIEIDEQPPAKRRSSGNIAKYIRVHILERIPELQSAVQAVSSRGDVGDVLKGMKLRRLLGGTECVQAVDGCRFCGREQRKQPRFHESNHCLL